jgi:3-deoxy-D-manno-octulosonic-acid transferase
VQLLLYNLFLVLYKVAIRLSSLVNDKAKRWLAGRKDILQTIKTTLPHDVERIWVHCASVGEFEQARQLIERLKAENATAKVILTFFSPSGYELRKDYKYADYVFYLPLDGKKRSARFIKMINPSLAIFVKYEFWYYYICNLERSNIPLVLISGAFREEQPFFKWYGGLFRDMLRKFSFFFLQDEASKKLLNDIGIDNAIVTGDTRYDRVWEIAQQAKRFPLIESWKGESKLLIAGSTWPDDERLVKECVSVLPDDWKILVAPHEIDAKHLKEIEHLFGSDAVFYSRITHADTPKEISPPGGCRLLVIDNIGMLSSLFRYGDIAYIGGGFQKGGIHNTLEPAVFGLPVLFGPTYEKFVEATELVKRGFAFPVRNPEECRNILHALISNEKERMAKSDALRQFVQSQVGATQNILHSLVSNSYLK